MMTHTRQSTQSALTPTSNQPDTIEFDDAHLPNHSKLPSQLKERITNKFYHRRAAGLNVQFQAGGSRDEWSFSTFENRDAFCRRLSRDGISFAISPIEEKES